MVLPEIYIILMIAGWVFLWARHIYLVRYKMNRYMMDHYKDDWKAMKDHPQWYERRMAGIYYSKAVKDFIWKSDIDYGDKNVRILKHKIKRIMLEFSIYVVVLIGSSAGIILYNL